MPVSIWFRGELSQYIRKLLVESRFLNYPLFDKGKILEILDEHQSGKSDHGYKLWTLMCLEIWHKNNEQHE